MNVLLDVTTFGGQSEIRELVATELDPRIVLMDVLRLRSNSSVASMCRSPGVHSAS
jgi:hypothetical protein